MKEKRRLFKSAILGYVQLV